MKRRVLIGSRMKGHQRGYDRQLTQIGDTTNLATTRTSWPWKHSKFFLISILWLMFTFCWFVLIYPISLVNSIVVVKMVCTRKKKWQNKRCFSQLSERDTGFTVGQNNQDEQTESRDNMKCRGLSSDNVSNPTQVNYPQVDAHTLEENIADKRRCEVDNMITSVDTRVPGVVLTAIDFLVTPRVELAMKPANEP